jgi:hypothetical protein
MTDRDLMPLVGGQQSAFNVATQPHRLGRCDPLCRLRHATDPASGSFCLRFELKSEPFRTTAERLIP